MANLAHKDKDEKANYTADTDKVVVSAAAELDDEDTPSEGEMSTLRKISAPLPWVGVAMCLIEFAERASYYGSKGPFNNFSGSPPSSALRLTG